MSDSRRFADVFHVQQSRDDKSASMWMPADARRTGPVDLLNYATLSFTNFATVPFASFNSAAICRIE